MEISFSQMTLEVLLIASDQFCGLEKSHNGLAVSGISPISASAIAIDNEPFIPTQVPRPTDKPLAVFLLQISLGRF